jgi:hypothetical protein
MGHRHTGCSTLQNLAQIEDFYGAARSERKKTGSRGGFYAAAPLTHMNRKTKPAEKPKQKSNLKPTAMKTVITSNSRRMNLEPRVDRSEALDLNREPAMEQLRGGKL